jgi:hypothetical protein
MIIDSRIGGLGDVWMRLLALYTVSGLVPDRHTLIVPASLFPIAEKLFSDRIEIVKEGKADAVYTHYGLRHLYRGMMHGVKYVHPFHWILHETNTARSIKTSINEFAIGVAARSGRLLLPHRDLVWEYQGFMELSALEPFADITVKQFEIASGPDLLSLSSILQKLIPYDGTYSDKVVVFPSGTAHQIMPPRFALDYLSSAIFAFHARDSFARDYEALGLRVVYFTSPEEMLALGHSARSVLCTDSFPSHLWQTWMTGTVVVLSQQTAKQVVHPGFARSQVVDSTAPCVKCRSRVRLSPTDTCDAGQVFCKTWADPNFIRSFHMAIGETYPFHIAAQ